MQNQFSRTELLLGREAMDQLLCARVAVFGLGGVGGYVVEALARSGVGALDLVDSDRVALTNLNRQILATYETLGELKVDAARRRIQAIHPQTVVRTSTTFFVPQTAEEFDFSQYSYIVDAIDTVTGKLELAERAQAAGVPIISCMGTGNKLNPAALEVADIYETAMCPLARIMRKELKKRGIRHLKVVYSREPPLELVGTPEANAQGRPAPGSTAFVPAAAGFIAAAEVIKDLTGVRTSPR